MPKRVFAASEKVAESAEIPLQRLSPFERSIICTSNPLWTDIAAKAIMPVLIPGLTNPKEAVVLRNMPRIAPAVEARIVGEHGGGFAIGCDEAGRGPIVGPLVVAAVALIVREGSRVRPATPDETERMPLCDSKKLTRESLREEALRALLLDRESGAEVLWAAVVVDEEAVDHWNILSASLTGMELAASIVARSIGFQIEVPELEGFSTVTVEGAAGVAEGHLVTVLCDGPRLPSGLQEGEGRKGEGLMAVQTASGYQLPCGWLKSSAISGEAIVKGDAKCRSIAAASIIAKTLRDRLMVTYIAGRARPDDIIYIRNGKEVTLPELEAPEFDGEDPYCLAGDKGYPTTAQKARCRRLGVGQHHRLSYRPVSDAIEGGCFSYRGVLARWERWMKQVENREAVVVRQKEAKKAARESTKSAQGNTLLKDFVS